MTPTQKPRPTIQELGHLMTKVVTIDTLDRINALDGVIKWYEEFIPFVRNTFTPDEEKKFQRAQMCVIQGRGGQTPGERETGLLTAIKMFEKALSRQTTPKVQDAMDKLEQSRPRLEEQARKTRERFQDIIGRLDTTLSPLGLTFKVSRTEKARQFDGDRQVILSEEYATSLLDRASREGFMSVVLGESVVALQAASMTKDALGSAKIDLSKMYTLLPTLFGRLVEVAKTTKSGLSFVVGDPKVTVVPNPVVPTPVQTPKVVVRPGKTSFYRPGTMYAEVLDKLMNAPGGRTTMKDLFSNLTKPAGDPSRVIGKITTDGKIAGKWEVTKTRQGDITFRLV